MRNSRQAGWPNRPTKEPKLAECADEDLYRWFDPLAWKRLNQ